MAHMKPLPPETTPELRDDFDIFDKILGFVPNSLLTMQRRPKMVTGFGALTKGVMDPEGAVDLGLMRLIAHFSSRAAGCQYCEAHSLVAAKIHDVSQEKLDAIWDYHGITIQARYIPRPSVWHWISHWPRDRCQMQSMQNCLHVCDCTGQRSR